MNRIPPDLSAHMKKIGKKGGKSGTGAKKARPASHYRKMTEIRRRNRLAKS